MSNIKVIRPQKGPQEKFLSTTADIAIYGGAAGGGKSYGLLIEPLRYKNNKRFGAVIFRHEYKQIFNQGGLWDTSNDVYGDIKGADGRYSAGMWKFRNGMTVAFDYINRDDDLQKWQGSQITMIGFDELTHFSEKQFFYMLSRNRSVCGVKPYMRATCNPDADSWVADFISWSTQLLKQRLKQRSSGRSTVLKSPSPCRNCCKAWSTAFRYTSGFSPWPATVPKRRKPRK